MSILKKLDSWYIGKRDEHGRSEFDDDANDPRYKDVPFPQRRSSSKVKVLSAASDSIKYNGDGDFKITFPQNVLVTWLLRDCLLPCNLDMRVLKFCSFNNIKVFEPSMHDVLSRMNTPDAKIKINVPWSQDIKNTMTFYIVHDSVEKNFLPWLVHTAKLSQDDIKRNMVCMFHQIADVYVQSRLIYANMNASALCIDKATKTVYIYDWGGYHARGQVVKAKYKLPSSQNDEKIVFELHGVWSLIIYYQLLTQNNEFTFNRDANLHELLHAHLDSHFDAVFGGNGTERMVERMVHYLKHVVGVTFDFRIPTMDVKIAPFYFDTQQFITNAEAGIDTDDFVETTPDLDPAPPSDTHATKPLFTMGLPPGNTQANKPSFPVALPYQQSWDERVQQEQHNVDDDDVDDDDDDDVDDDEKEKLIKEHEQMLRQAQRAQVPSKVTNGLSNSSPAFQSVHQHLETLETELNGSGLTFSASSAIYPPHLIAFSEYFQRDARVQTLFPKPFKPARFIDKISKQLRPNLNAFAASNVVKSDFVPIAAGSLSVEESNAIASKSKKMVQRLYHGIVMYLYKHQNKENEMQFTDREKKELDDLFSFFYKFLKIYTLCYEKSNANVMSKYGKGRNAVKPPKEPAEEPPKEPAEEPPKEPAEEPPKGPAEEPLDIELTQESMYEEPTEKRARIGVRPSLF